MEEESQRGSVDGGTRGNQGGTRLEPGEELGGNQVGTR